jgi:hypothetical protein
VVTFGRRGEHFGAGRIEVEDAVWQEEFIRLFERAQKVFVVPAATPSSFWELQYLKSREAFSRCYFIMPPAFTDSDQRKEECKIVGASVKHLGLEFPEYDPAGGWFAINSEGGASQLERPKNWRAAGLRKWLATTIFHESWFSRLRSNRQWLAEAPLVPSIGVAICWASIARAEVASPLLLSLAYFATGTAFIGLWYNFPSLSKIAASFAGIGSAVLLLQLFGLLIWFLLPGQQSIELFQIFASIAWYPFLGCLVGFFLVWLSASSTCESRTPETIRFISLCGAIFTLGGICELAYFVLFSALGASYIKYSPAGDGRAIGALLTGVLVIRQFERYTKLAPRHLSDLFSGQIGAWRPRFWTFFGFILVIGLQFTAADLQRALAGQAQEDERLDFIARASVTSVCILLLFLWWLIAHINRGIPIKQHKGGIALVVFAALTGATVASALVGYVSVHVGQDWPDAMQSGVSFFHFYLVPLIRPTFVALPGLVIGGVLMIWLRSTKLLSAREQLAGVLLLGTGTC